MGPPWGYALQFDLAVIFPFANLLSFIKRIHLQAEPLVDKGNSVQLHLCPQKIPWYVCFLTEYCIESIFRISWVGGNDPPELMTEAPTVRPELCGDAKLARSLNTFLADETQHAPSTT